MFFAGAALDAAFKRICRLVLRISKNVRLIGFLRGLRRRRAESKIGQYDYVLVLDHYIGKIAFAKQVHLLRALFFVRLDGLFIFFPFAGQIFVAV